MRRLITIVRVLSLAGAGVAYACDQADSVKQVTATFSATTGQTSTPARAPEATVRTR